MPVTATLSRKFYEAFGEDVTNEADLRELNELNFSRFVAKLEQRLAEVDARLAEFDARWSTRIAELDVKWSGVWTQPDAKWSGHWTQLDAKLDRRLAELERKLIRWMFAFWAPTTIAIFTLLFRR